MITDNTNLYNNDTLIRVDIDLINYVQNIAKIRHMTFKQYMFSLLINNIDYFNNVCNDVKLKKRVVNKSSANRKLFWIPHLTVNVTNVVYRDAVELFILDLQKQTKRG